MIMFKKIGKNKKLLSGILCGLIGLSACTENIKNSTASGTGTEASAVAASSASASGKLVYDDKVPISKDAQQLVNRVM